jgi:ATP-dependent DNA helicase MPH1
MSDDFDDLDLADEELILALECAPTASCQQQKGSRPSDQPASLDQITLDLNNFDPGAFDSSPEQPFRGGHQGHQGLPTSRALIEPRGNQIYRQKTLWGTAAVQNQDEVSTSMTSNRVFRADLPPEAPTHHALNHDALVKWVYPTNLGPTRDYQFSIVKNGLFNNTLVALPTGLGKTFIAATVMLNFYRWTRTAKIVFVAPTKPLASQQVEACLNVAGIPRSDSTLLTGEVAPALREQEWSSRRLFFMTPQTLQNDLAKGYADPKSIALLVVDEAHRATGEYAYVKVVDFLRRFNKSFRVLALTATPGSKVEGVQDVIDALGISHVEIRTEESIDIRQYVHSREIDRVILGPSDEMLRIEELFSKALKPICDVLSQRGIWAARDPMSITNFGLVQARAKWMSSDAARHLNQGVKGMILAVFTLLLRLAHPIRLLKYHGIKPFFEELDGFRAEAESKGSKGGKWTRKLLEDSCFQEMMDITGKWLRLRDFVGHPKLTHLADTLLNHFMDKGPGSSTRAIVFSEFRDSAEEIVRAINIHKPLLSATIFVGQAETKRGTAGMTQKQQIETIQRFRNGDFNILIATSIGEEGLDIGQVDLIVCYDASSSPIRMLQRMGRTGRKRAGNIVVLLMKGKEEEKFASAQDNYQQMQKMICEGSRFNFRHDLSSRIVPRNIKPEVDMRLVEIPMENTQDTSLPEPRRGNARGKAKASKKKFHMPDGVETGFMKASSIGKASTKSKKPAGPLDTYILAEIPPLNKVVLSEAETRELDRLYRDIPGFVDQVEMDHINNCLHPEHQRRLTSTILLKHGECTKRYVKLFNRMGRSQGYGSGGNLPYGLRDESDYLDLPVLAFVSDIDEEVGHGFATAAGSRPPKRQRIAEVYDEDHEEAILRPQKRKVIAKAKSKPRRKQEQQNHYFSEVSEGVSDQEEAGASEAPAACRRGGAKRGGRGGRGGRGRLSSSWQDRGDDCTRTSDNYESEGSDNGSDLLDFIVGDDEITSSMQRESLTSPTTASLPTPDKSRGKENEAPFYMPTLFPQTQDSDEEVPDVSMLGKPKPARTGLSGTSDSEDGELAPHPARRKRRPVFMDSDSD